MKVEEQRVAYPAARSTVPAEWPIVPFEQAATPQSDRGKRIKQRDYLPEGRIPVIDQGQSPIGGYTDDEDFAFSGELPVVLFGDHTRAVKLVSHRFAVGADGIKIFRPAEGVRPKYLYYWMKSARIPDRGYGRHYQYLRQLSVPLPPPAKQDEIVAEIEKQFSRLDEAVANLKRVKANLKRYKAAVLKAAVEGRLVESEAELAHREGRSCETGAQLLQRILETRRSKWKGKGKYKEPAAPDTTDLPELPEGWVWCGFEQVSAADKHALKAGPFGSALKKEFYVESGYKIYGQEQVIRGDSTFGDYFIDETKYRELESCAVKPGDLLISLVGTAGKVLVLPPTAAPGIINPRLLKLSLDQTHIEPAYAAYMLQSVWARHYFKLQAHGGTMEILNLGIIKALPVPLPPLAEQNRIVSEVDRQLSLADEAEGQVNANHQRAEHLRQSILSRAFTGVSASSTIAHTTL